MNPPLLLLDAAVLAIVVEMTSPFELTMIPKDSLPMAAAFVIFVLIVRRRSEPSRRHVRRSLKHPYTLTHALMFATMMRVLIRDPETPAFAQRAAEHATENGFAYFADYSILLRACASADLTDESLSRLREAFRTWRANGNLLAATCFAATIAEPHVQAGQLDVAQAIVDEGLAQVDATDERVVEAELWRLRGEIVRQQGERRQPSRTAAGAKKDEAASAAAADECFRQAIEIARRQRAKLYELRATVSLSRSLQRQGKSTEARERLTQIYEGGGVR